VVIDITFLRQAELTLSRFPFKNSFDTEIYLPLLPRLDHQGSLCIFFSVVCVVFARITEHFTLDVELFLLKGLFPLDVSPTRRQSSAAFR